MPDRIQLVLEKGRLLAVRNEKHRTVALYYLDNFFAELGYKPNPNPADIANFFRSQSRIIFIQGFDNQLKLEPYLDLINLPEI